MILQTSSGSIRNVPSLSNVTRPGATPIFASTVRPITVPDGTIMVRYGTYDPFVLGVKPRVNYLGGDGMADEWWSTMSQRSPLLT
jgi:hypothetical protein